MIRLGLSCFPAILSPISMYMYIDMGEGDTIMTIYDFLEAS